jgi:hypothetical protein
MDIQKHDSIQSLSFNTGVLLVASVLLPLTTPSETMVLEFPDFALLQSPMMSWAMRVQILFPLLAGILVFVARVQASYKLRLSLYLVAGFFPLLLLPFLETGSFASNDIGDWIGSMLGMRDQNGQMLVALALGLIGLVAGAFAEKVNPESKIPRAILFAGATFMLTALVIPVDFGEGPTVMLAIPFAFFDKNVWTALELLVFNGCLLSAAVLGILGFVKPKALNVSKPIKLLVLWAFVSGMLFFLFQGVLAFYDDPTFNQEFFYLLTLLMKAATIFAGSILAKCLGLIEWAAHSKPQAQPTDPQAI